MRTLTLFKRFFRFGIHIIIGKIEGYNFWLSFWIFKNKKREKNERVKTEPD